MDFLRRAKDFAQQGRFSLALRELDSFPRSRERPTVSVLKSELLQRVGRTAEADHLARAALKSNASSASDRSLAHYVLGRIHADANDLDSAVRELQQSIQIALRAGDHERAAWSQCRLLMIVSDATGPDS